MWIIGTSVIGLVTQPSAVQAAHIQCADDVVDESTLRTAVDAFLEETDCDLIEITDSFTLGGPVEIQKGDGDFPAAVNKSLTIRGNGHVISRDETVTPSFGGLFVILSSVNTLTLTIDKLGLSGFGRWGALTLGKDPGLDESADLVITNSRFTRNVFSSDPITGVDMNATAGAVNTHGPLTIIDSEFIDNDGVYGGAVHNASDEPTVISGSTFAGNDASESGGALNVAGYLELVNSTLSGNSAKQNSALVTSGDVTITFCTIVDNVATSGPANAIFSGGRFTMSSSIVTDNVDGDGNPGTDINASGEVDIESSLLTSEVSTTVNFVPFTLDPPDTNLYGLDPDLEPLGNYGGFTLPGGSIIQTRPPRVKSPVIDYIERVTAVSTFALSDPEPTDQRGAGYSRYVNGRADIGAVEYRPITQPPQIRRSIIDFELPSTLPDTV